MDDREIRKDGTENRIKGRAEELKGKVRGDVGDAVDDRSQHLKGRAEQLKGKARRKFGEVQESIAGDEHDERDRDESTRDRS